MLDQESSYLAIRRSAGVYRRGDAVLCVKGAQRQAYVLWLLAKSIQFVGIDACADSVLLDADGHVVGVAVAILREDRIYVLVEASPAWHQAAGDAAKNFDVSVETMANSAVQVEGPLSWAVVQDALVENSIEDVLLGECVDAAFDGQSACLARVGTSAEYGYLVVSDAVDVFDHLVARAQAVGGGEIDPTVLPRVRVEANYPAMPHQTVDCSLFESGLAWLATVTRADAYAGSGRLDFSAPTRRTVAAYFAGSDCPEVGTPVTDDGVVVGHVLVSTPRVGQPDGLGLLLLDDPFGVPGLELEAGGATASTVSRPTLTPRSWSQQIGSRP